MTALATLVAAGFIWSVALFVVAVFVRERDQQAGFGWALLGAVLFFVTFADQLPEALGDARLVAQYLPRVDRETALTFESSKIALIVLAVVYLFRVAVFYQLFLKDGVDLDGDREEDQINDLVAPALSYLCFAICLVSLLRPAYELSVVATALLIGFLVLFHYAPILRKLLRLISDLFSALWVFASRLKRGLAWLVLQTILLIARSETAARQDDSPGRLSAWAERNLDALQREAADARQREREAVRKTVKNFSENRRRRDGQTGSTP